MRHLALLLALALVGCKGNTKPPEDQVPPYPWAAQAWRAELRAKLHATRVTKDFEAVPLELVLREVCGMAAVNVRLDPALVHEPPRDQKPPLDLQVIHVRLHDLPADDALSAILDPLGLTWTLHEEVVLVSVHAQEHPSPADDLGERILRAEEEHAALSQRQTTKARLDRLEVSIDYQDSPLDEVVRDLAKQGHVEIQFDRAGLEPRKDAARVRQRMEKVHFMSLLRLVLESFGLGVRWRGAELRIVPRAEAEIAADAERKDAELAAKPVTLDAKGVPIRELRKLLEKAVGLPVLLDEATWQRQEKVTLQATDMDLNDVLLRIRQEGKCAAFLLDGAVYLLTSGK